MWASSAVVQHAQTAGVTPGSQTPAVLSSSSTRSDSSTSASTAGTALQGDLPAEVVSYQGRLSDGGAPANGSYDFQFLLMDAATAGTPVAEALKHTLLVRNGVFSASLAWSASLFPGTARWIEVRVRPTPATGTPDSAAPYAVLERQRIHSAPYAFRSSTASTVDSVPVQSLPSQVPLKGADGKIDSSLLAADIARVAALDGVSKETVSLKASLAGLAADVENRVKALTEDATSTKSALQTLQKSDMARATDIVSLDSDLKALRAKWEASQDALLVRVESLAKENATLRQSVQVLSAPARSGWMVASFSPTDSDLLRDGFSLVSAVPAPDWKVGSTNGAPTARTGAASVWTGQEWIIWGGLAAGNLPVKTGARYRPDLDLWSSLTTYDSPSERSGHSAVWTGKEMIVWGGATRGAFLNGGARYTANPQSWVALNPTGAPSGRIGHSAVWTGRYMVVFGGRNNNGMLADGGLYDPVADRWVQLPAAGSPPGARMGATMIWTGKALIVWGGFSNTGHWASGAVLAFDAQGVPGAWTSLPAPSGFSGRMGHVGAWDGQRLLIWGGRSSSGQILGDGAVWDSVTGVWTPLDSVGAPTPRYDATGVWTGEEFVVFGGNPTTRPVGATMTGAAWRPGTGWRPLPQPVAGSARNGALSAWTGSSLLVFGGSSESGLPLADLQRLEVRSPWYLYRRGALPSTTSSISNP